MWIKYFFMLFLIGMTSSYAGEVEHVLWDKTPIQLSLPLNQERMIRFPLNINLIDSELDQNVSVLKVQDALYLNAHDVFNNKRMVVQLMPEGEVIILNLSASKDTHTITPVQIIMEEKNDKTTESSSPDANLNAITLTRFAIQSLYSPERLLVIPAGVTRTPMQTERHINLMYGASVQAKPLISWRGGDLYITAIEFKNILNHEISLNAERLMGQFQTAVFYPSNTLKARTQADTTTLFVITDKPFNEALRTQQEFVR